MLTVLRPMGFLINGSSDQWALELMDLRIMTSPPMLVVYSMIQPTVGRSLGLNEFNCQTSRSQGFIMYTMLCPGMLALVTPAIQHQGTLGCLNGWMKYAHVTQVAHRVAQNAPIVFPVCPDAPNSTLCAQSVFTNRPVH